MFQPNYTITDTLLNIIVQVTEVVTELNHQTYPDIIMESFSQSAGEVAAGASAAIGGNQLTPNQVHLLLRSRQRGGQQLEKSEQAVGNYYQALQTIQQTSLGLSELRTKDVLMMHRTVMRHLLPTKQAGAYRQQPTVIHDQISSNVVFIPPEPEDIPALVEDLCDFIVNNAEAIHPLLLAGLVQKQLVLIHPFIAGNGRTARLVARALLARVCGEITELCAFEQYYQKNTPGYIAAIGETGVYDEMADSLDFTPWLEYFAEGVLQEVQRVQRELPVFRASPETVLRDHDRAALQYVTQHGFITDREYANLVDRAKATRALDFKRLQQLGMLERQGGGRSTYYTLKVRE